MSSLLLCCVLCAEYPGGDSPSPAAVSGIEAAGVASQSRTAPANEPARIDRYKDQPFNGTTDAQRRASELDETEAEAREINAAGGPDMLGASGAQPAARQPAPAKHSAGAGEPRPWEPRPWETARKTPGRLRRPVTVGAGQGAAAQGGRSRRTGASASHARGLGAAGRRHASGRTDVAAGRSPAADRSHADLLAVGGLRRGIPHRRRSLSPLATTRAAGRRDGPGARRSAGRCEDFLGRGPVARSGS